MSALAKESGFQKREPRKIGKNNLVISVCQLAVKTSASFNDIAEALGLKSGCSVSRQAVWKKFNGACLLFFQMIMAYIISRVIGDGCIKGQFRVFKRILLQDSTTLQLPEKFKELFPGSANQNKQGCAAKIQCVYELISENFAFFRITPFTDNDQKEASGILDIAKQGDLIIRDMGYFVIDRFREMTLTGIYFISRVVPGVVFYTETGKRINLLQLLKKSGDIDLNVLMGRLKVPVRLVAIPVPDKILEKRRRTAKKDSRVKRSREYMELLGWNIFITNVESGVLTPSQIFQLYSMRWRIEIIFKTWKSFLNFERFHHNIGLTQLMVFICARLIVVSVLHSGINSFDEYIYNCTGRRLSILKVHKFIGNNIDSLLITFTENSSGATSLIDILYKNCTYEKRRRINYAQEKTMIRHLFTSV